MNKLSPLKMSNVSIIVVGLLTLVCVGFVPRAVASDMPAGFSLNATEVERYWLGRRQPRCQTVTRRMESSRFRTLLRLPGIPPLELLRFTTLPRAP